MLQLQLETEKEHPRDVLPLVPYLIPSTFTSSITHLITVSPLLLPCLPRWKNKTALFLPSRKVSLREGLIPEEARHDILYSPCLLSAGLELEKGHIIDNTLPLHVASQRANSRDSGRSTRVDQGHVLTSFLLWQLWMHSWDEGPTCTPTGSRTGSHTRALTTFSCWAQIWTVCCCRWPDSHEIHQSHPNTQIRGRFIKTRVIPSCLLHRPLGCSSCDLLWKLLLSYDWDLPDLQEKCKCLKLQAFHMVNSQSSSTS